MPVSHYFGALTFVSKNAFETMRTPSAPTFIVKRADWVALITRSANLELVGKAIDVKINI